MVTSIDICPTKTIEKWQHIMENSINSCQQIKISWWKIHLKIIKNAPRNHEKSLFLRSWGVLGAPGGAPGAILGSKSQKSEETMIRWTPPGSPDRWGAKIMKNRHVGVPEGSFVALCTNFGRIFGGSCFRPVFWRPESQKSSDFERAEPLKSDDTTTFFKDFSCTWWIAAGA